MSEGEEVVKYLLNLNHSPLKQKFPPLVDSTCVCGHCNWGQHSRGEAAVEGGGNMRRGSIGVLVSPRDSASVPIIKIEAGACLAS